LHHSSIRLEVQLAAGEPAAVAGRLTGKERSMLFRWAPFGVAADGLASRSQGSRDVDVLEDGHIDRNPARGKRMRVRVPKPQRTFLELDELAALIDAAAMQDAPSTPQRVRANGGATATLVAERLSRGMTQTVIAAELGLARATVNWHARRLGVEGTRYAGRAFVVRVLGYSGVRNPLQRDHRSLLDGHRPG
jgi:hypothetical protein